jgi:hypothetical protein
MQNAECAVNNIRTRGLTKQKHVDVNLMQRTIFNSAPTLTKTAHVNISIIRHSKNGK